MNIYRAHSSCERPSRRHRRAHIAPEHRALEHRALWRLTGAVSGLDAGTAGDGEARSTSCVASTRFFWAVSAILFICSMSRTRTGLLVGVFRAFAWTMSPAHDRLRTGGSPVEMAASMRTRKASGVAREKRGSRDAGDHEFSKRKELVGVKIGGIEPGETLERPSG